MLKTKLKIMEATAQSPRRGVSHTPQTHTPQTHTPQSHTFHHRRSIRLKGYDYSADGLYFITICTKDKNHYFGRVIDGKMILNERGQIVKNEWLNTINVRQGEVILHEFIVMPNHFHAIVEICRRGVSHTPQSHTPQSHTPQMHTPQSYTLQSHTPQSYTPQIHTPDDGLTSDRGTCDTTNNGVRNATNNGVCDTIDNGVCDTMDRGVCDTMDRGVCDTMDRGVCDTMDRGVCDTPLRSPSKTLGAIVRGFKSAVTKQIGFPIWQRNYHEHIIRNTNAFTKISNYIRNNPAQWHSDMFNKG